MQLSNIYSSNFHTNYNSAIPEINQRFRNVKKLLEQSPPSYTKIEPKNNFTILKQVLENSLEYASFDYIVKHSKIRPEEVEKLLANNKEFRKSFISNFENQPIYALKKNISLFKDIWKTFCYINSVKF